MVLPAVALESDVPAPRRGGGALELLALGGGTVLLFPLAWLLRRAVGADPAELAAGFLTFHAAYVINDPHFAVTYLLFYTDVRERLLGRKTSVAQRLRYLTAGFVAPAVLLAWAGHALATHAASGLGALVELMFLLVGWHYVKQGFGVLALLCARRGSPLGRRERGALLFHAYAGWAYAWANPSRPAQSFEEHGVVFRSFAHPGWLELGAAAALAVSVAWLGFVLGTARRRGAPAMPWGPLSVFLSTVWLWSIYSALDPVVTYLVPALHSVQYLYVVGLRARGEHRRTAGPFAPPATGRLALLGLSAVALGFLLFHAVPGVLDAALDSGRVAAARGDLGPTPFAAAFFVFVNVHHYLMDAVIWRREDPRVRSLTVA